MNRRASPLIALVGLFGLLMVAGPVLAANGAVTIKEADERYSYSPKTVYVNVGESVTWKNGTDAPHTVTSDGGDELASENLAEDATFDHAFSATGTFAYHCTIHTYMKGSIVVLAAGVTPPATETVSGSAPAREPSWIGIALIAFAGLAAAGLAVRRVRSVV
jgi:plastocyanin